MWEPDYFVRLVAFPCKIDGVTIPNDDGSFDIYINSLLSEEKRNQKLQHELEHIRRDHFYSLQSICSVEAEANGERQKRRVVYHQGVRSGDPTKIIPLFESLEQFKEFYKALKRNGRCGDYVLVSTPEEASLR